MKKLKFLSALLLLTALLLPIISPAAMAAENIEITAPAAILVEATSGTIIYEKNAYTPMYPASITKIMTILLACEYIEDGIVQKDELVEITEEAWEGMEEDAMNLGIDPGEDVPFIDLMYCAMLASANEACNAIAIHTSHDIDTFVSEMNRRAAALGCRDTHFVTANGLHDDNHYTTAYDMYLILNEALTHPLFKEIFGTKFYKMPPTNKSGSRSMYHTNRLMNEEHANYYEYCTGGKTGSTSHAGYCLASTAEKDGMSFICVVIGAGRTQIDKNTYTLNTYTDSVALYNWGFDNYSYRAVLSPEESVSSIPVYMGDGADAVDLVPTEEISLFLPNEGAEEDLSISVTLYDDAAKGNLRAPVDQGEILGEITVYYKGSICGTVKGAAASSVKLKHTEYIKTEISATLSLGWVKNAIFILISVFALYTMYIILYMLLRYTRRRRNFKRAQQYAASIRMSARAASAAEAEANRRSERVSLPVPENDSDGETKAFTAADHAEENEPNSSGEPPATADGSEAANDAAVPSAEVASENGAEEKDADTMSDAEDKDE